MRLGFVRSLNARPLDYGFSQKGTHEIIYEVPSVLSAMLREGRLDAALISSVECFRHEHILSYCNKVGVCSHSAVRSILYLRPFGMKGHPGEILADRGSRTSAALLSSLIYKETNTMPDLIETDPEEIPVIMKKHQGGLIIGDPALDFEISPYYSKFQVTDLGRWWNESEHLPFVFALWAYPSLRPVSDELFIDSLSEGLKHIDSIAATSPYTKSYEYLTTNLHFQINEPERKALLVFRERLQAAGLV